MVDDKGSNLRPSVADAGSYLKLERCQIRGNRGAGAYVVARGGGEFIDCDIHSNTLGVVVTDKDSRLQLARCKIRDNADGGVAVHKQGGGEFTDC